MKRLLPPLLKAFSHTVKKACTTDKYPLELPASLVIARPHAFSEFPVFYQ